VAWKMWRELRVEAGEGDEADVVSATVPRSFAAAAGVRSPMSA
jgi:hypothetical protein